MSSLPWPLISTICSERHRLNMGNPGVVIAGFLIQGNLAVIAEVLVEDRLVRVLAVWAFVPLA